MNILDVMGVSKYQDIWIWKWTNHLTFFFNYKGQ